MRATLLLLPAVLCAADAAPQVTADDLQNLVVCARRTVGSLSPAEMQTVVAAIAHAEADIAELRKPRPVTVPAPPSHSATAAAVKP